MLGLSSATSLCYYPVREKEEREEERLLKQEEQKLEAERIEQEKRIVAIATAQRLVVLYCRSLWWGIMGIVRVAGFQSTMIIESLHCVEFKVHRSSNWR